MESGRENLPSSLRLLQSIGMERSLQSPGRKNFLFWRAVPAVTASLRSAPGLIGAIGIGEAPIGLQGTFSIWEDPKTISYFAYRGEAHKEVIAATAREKWYAEEMFGRFALIDSSGVL